MKKRGALELSFGMIFSIILIIVFIAAAIYSIIKFLDFQDTLKIEKFANDLQADVDNLWKSTQGSSPREYSLPTKIISVCFSSDEFENLQFVSERIIKGKMISHIDIPKTLKGRTSSCFDNLNGKVSMTLKKGYGENLITIE